MTRIAPLFVSDRSAAAMLDMKLDRFRALVAAGALPTPCRIAGDVERWDVDELRATIKGWKPVEHGGIDV